MQTGDVVRSTAAMMVTWFAVGSHDGLLHVCTLGRDSLVQHRAAYNPNTQTSALVPITAAPAARGGSAQLASPCVDTTGWCCNATLSGLVFAVMVTVTTGRPPVIQSQWQQSLQEPIFASPLHHRALVVVATAKGQVCALDANTGQRRWQCQLLGGIFAAGGLDPSMVGDSFAIPSAQRPKRCTSLWVTTNQCELARVDLDDGALLTRVVLPGNSSSTPWVDCYDVLVTTVTGHLCQYRHATRVLEVLTAIAEPVFSAPVRWQSLVLFGARDDQLHAVACATSGDLRTLDP